jgi:hypothetical protein
MNQDRLDFAVASPIPLLSMLTSLLCSLAAESDEIAFR